MICQTCGIEFTARTSHQMFCSKSCRDKSYEKHRPSTRACTFCGTEFRTRNPRHSYCSAKCKDKAKAGRRGRKGWRKDTCKHCGTEIWKQRSNKIYCSKSCKNATRYTGSRTYYLRECPVCEVYFIGKTPRAKYCSKVCQDILDMKRQPYRPSEINEPTRTCHDCGTPCDNYRCDSCWQAVREGQDVLDMVDFGVELNFGVD